jgi:HSP20 family protein
MAYSRTICGRSLPIAQEPDARTSFSGDAGQAFNQGLRYERSRGEYRCGSGGHFQQAIVRKGEVTMVDFKALVPWRHSRSQPTAARADFFAPFVSFRREMDRIFERGFSGSALHPGQGSWHGVTPAIAIDENDKELVVTAELPGVSEKEIEVSLTGDVLTITGEKRSQREERYANSSYVERRFGSFSRSLRLPFEVKEQGVNAQFQDGVLTIRLPKPTELQKPARRIDARTV